MSETSGWESLAQEIAKLLAGAMRPATTLPMFNALAALHKSVSQLGVMPHETEGTEMSTPTPDMRSIDQNDINAWATNVNAAVTAIITVIAGGNLSPADESTMNTALGLLDGVAGATTTPPADPPADPPVDPNAPTS